MKLITRFCFAIALFAPLSFVTTEGREKSCEQHDYRARTDRRIEPYPETPPAIGSAGSIITDPSFGSRILRVTDEKSDPEGRRRSMMTSASGEQNIWNAESTKFYLLTPGGQYVLYKFDPVRFSAHEEGMLPVRWSGDPEFSYTQPDVIYGFRPFNAAFQQYDTATGNFARIHFISECVKLKDSETGHSVVVSADDQRLVTILGPRQDLNHTIYVYDRKLGCRWYNTETGEIGGKWGPVGTISAGDRYFIHNARISKSGEFIWIARGESIVGKNWLVWEVATMNVVACPSQCSGHHAMGYSHLAGPSGERHPLDMIERPLREPDNVTHLVSGLEPTDSDRYWYDEHLSWNHTSPDDTTPFCLSTYTKNPRIAGVPLETISPWESEILCVETDGKDSRVWRFAHHYSTASGGFWSTPRGNVSRDGRFFLFTSDWQGELGSRHSESEPFRTDAFIVELQ